MPLERVRSLAAPGACSSMRMGCPSSAMLSNWLLAFMASARASYTTSAVPIDRPLRQQRPPNQASTQACDLELTLGSPGAVCAAQQQHSTPCGLVCCTAQHVRKPHCSAWRLAGRVACGGGGPAVPVDAGVLDLAAALEQLLDVLVRHAIRQVGHQPAPGTEALTSTAALPCVLIDMPLQSCRQACERTPTRPSSLG